MVAVNLLIRVELSVMLQWGIQQKDLDLSASRKDGITVEEETILRAKSIIFLRSFGKALKL